MAFIAAETVEDTELVDKAPLARLCSAFTILDTCWVMSLAEDLLAARSDKAALAAELPALI
jgi:hypothetical protein